MIHGLRQRLSYANVMATLAVFIALGGSSYAALRISGANIVNNSVRSTDIRNGTLLDRDVRTGALTGRSIRESSLARVPRAANADRVGGVSAASLRVRCPTDTFPVADVCVERVARRAASYGSAVLECAQVGTPGAPGRRLPTHGELRAALAGVPLAAGGELTSELSPSASTPGSADVLFVTDAVGSVGVTPNTGAGAKAFRCVADPIN